MKNRRSNLIKNISQAFLIKSNMGVNLSIQFSIYFTFKLKNYYFFVNVIFISEVFASRMASPPIGNVNSGNV